MVGMSGVTVMESKGGVALGNAIPKDTVTLLRAILQATDHGVLLTDLDHHSLACNRRFGEIFKLDPEDVVVSGVKQLRKKVLPLIAEPKLWLASLERVYAEPETVYEDDLVLKGPSPTVLRRYSGPVHDQDGALIGRLWTFRDVTAERRMQQMHELLHQVGAMYDPDPTVVCRKILRIISTFYDRSTALLSIRHDDYMEFKAVAGPLSGLTLMKGNGIGDSYCQFALRSVQPVLIQNAKTVPEYIGIRACRAGYTRYLGVPVKDEADQAIGTLCILDNKIDQELNEEDVRFLSLMAGRVNAELARERSIQERLAAKDSILTRQQEDLATTHQVLNAMNTAFSIIAEVTSHDELLKEQARLLRGLLSYGASAVLTVSEDGQKLRGFATSARSSRATAVSLPVSEVGEIWASKSASPVIESCEPCERIQKLLGAPFVTFARLPKGNEGWALVMFGSDTRGGDEDARHKMHLEALIDQVYLVLASHSLQEELRGANEELTATHTQLVQSEKLSAIGTLAASTAHDIRNILSSLSMLVSPGQYEPELALEAVREQLDRFSVLAHRLLSYAKPRLLARHSVNLDDILKRVLALTSGQCRIMNVRTVYRPAPGAIELQADPHQLEHLFVNIILNAVQAMDAAGGTLTISAAVLGSGARIKISDTGAGISKDVAARLFEPFASTRSEGFGLGLYSCKRIVEAHGGTINADRNVMRGTTFTIVLPMQQRIDE